ncbi:hypothetical protein EV426DRAFT_618150 [Tirmania nivea]|nr:hypothetical protein EV426DRAFT_618150 [Tirmania nivea]
MATASPTNYQAPGILGGLEDITIHPFISTYKLRKLVETKATSLLGGGPTQQLQYLAIRNVTQTMWGKIQENQRWIGPIRLTYDFHDELLIVKVMPWPSHEAAHCLFTTRLILKLSAMGMGPSDLIGTGAGTFRASRSAKQADCTYKPRQRDRIID